MDEFDYIEQIKQQYYRQYSLIKGVGDDAAVYQTGVQSTVTAIDTFVEGVHFTNEMTTPFYIGYRALAANISDIAAMGAIPSFYLVSIVIPPHINEDDILSIYHGMENIAKPYNMDLIGGDTVSGKELTISITIIGQVPIECVRYRSNARPRDVIFVTGTLGDAAAGLHILQQEYDTTTIKNKEYLTRRHLQPSPRVKLMQKVRHIKRIALNDVSDGIANELREIADASNVDIQIDDMKIPLSDALKQFSNANQSEWKYYGGEDFELVGTLPESDFEVLHSKACELGLKVTKIGNVFTKQSDTPEVYVRENKQITRLEKHGYTHLSRSKEDEI